MNDSTKQTLVERLRTRAQRDRARLSLPNDGLLRVSIPERL